MRISEWIKKKVLSFLGLEHLSENPNDIRLEFLMGDDDYVWRERVNEYLIWYSGQADELYNYYTGAKMSGVFARSPIYNRPKRDYFWSITTNLNEKVKKTHSGVPRSIVDTLINVIGEPINLMEDNEKEKVLDKILDNINFKSLMSQEQMAMTCVEGWGAYKINFNKDFSDYPTVQFYEANDCEFIYKDNVLIGIIYKDYYKDKNDHEYLLCETRHRDTKNSYIDYELFRMNGEDIKKCELSEVPELAHLENLVIENFPHILGVPSIFYYDQFHKGYGRSIYAGKLDIFDDLDQCLSQASTTVKYSTPVEYLNAEFLQRGPNGQEALPNVYCRRYIMLEGEMDADGKGNAQAVTVTQPNLNIEQFSKEYSELLKSACNGILSVTTLGIMDEKQPNANAQREREKVTIMTRNNIIAKQSHILSELYNLLLCVYEFMQKGKITRDDYGVVVKFQEFALPSFENELQILGGAWSAGQLSTEQYVGMLWKNLMSPEEMQQEIEALERNKDLRFNAAQGGDSNVEGDGITEGVESKQRIKKGDSEQRIWVHNDKQSRYIKISEQSDYLNKGYMFGR